MDRRLIRPLVGTLAAIAITTVMDVKGLAAFSALSLFPLVFLFWYCERFSRQEVGLIWGRRKDYRLAVLYPLVVLGAATLIATVAGVVDLSETNWKHFWINLVVGGASTVLVAIVTEEGFFRGWLWASLGKAGCTQNQALLWSSVAFTLWHVSAVTLDTGFDLPAPQIPIYLLNGLLIGLIWGMIRLVSGSVVVASVSHGVWNGLTYALFAFGGPRWVHSVFRRRPSTVRRLASLGWC